MPGKPVCSLYDVGVSDLGRKWVRFAPNWTNLGLLKVIFQKILAHALKDDLKKLGRQNILKNYLQKSQICPILYQSDAFSAQICNPWNVERVEESIRVTRRRNFCFNAES